MESLKKKRMHRLVNACKRIEEKEKREEEEGGEE